MKAWFFAEREMGTPGSSPLTRLVPGSPIASSRIPQTGEEHFHPLVTLLPDGRSAEVTS